jgi:NNMT/PNMT/TEMT family
MYRNQFWLYDTYNSRPTSPLDPTITLKWQSLGYFIVIFALVQSNIMADREPSVRNDEAAWSEFDADGYWKFNYASVLPEDAEIIRYASEFLIRTCGTRLHARRAVDIGAGTNLYPALLMLPWARNIVFTEYAESNIRWLGENLAHVSSDWPWQPFWDLVAGLPCYQTIQRPRHRLAVIHEIQRLSVFDLPRRAWDLGCMFFVADGITEDEEEFESAVRMFLGALTPGAPFIMAFMDSSSGYDVSGVGFPAVRVTPTSLNALISTLPVTGINILRTDNSIRRLRSGYDAMLLVTGIIAELSAALRHVKGGRMGTSTAARR